MKSKQSGSTVVEFALVLIVFLMFFLGITDFARMLFTWAQPTKHRAMAPGSRQFAAPLSTNPMFWRECEVYCRRLGTSIWHGTRRLALRLIA